jgi:hypothetical protein
VPHAEGTHTSFQIPAYSSTPCDFRESTRSAYRAFVACLCSSS